MAAIASPIPALQRRLFDHIDLRVRNRARAQEFFAQVLPAIGFALDKSAEKWGAFEKDGAGKPVALANALGSSRYALGDRKGRSAFAGRIETEGTCSLSATYPSDWIPGPGSEVVLAVGRGFGGMLTKILAVGGISLGAGILIGTLVIVMTARRRRRIPPRASE